MRAIYFILIGLFCFHAGGYAKEKRALIVAISQYPEHSGWRPIHADNDVKLLLNTLKKKGFLEKNIIVLRDAQASKHGVVAGLQSLQGKVKAGDFVFIHFSCHGQQMEDDDGDEPDGLDEAIVCYDAKMHYSAGRYEGENHLRDDELDAYLRPIRKTLGETGQLIVSFDACHSESATRGEDEDERVVRGTATVFSRSGTVRPKFGASIKPPLFQEKGLSPITELSACQSNQNNYEYQKGDEYYGSLTYALCTVWDRYSVLPAWHLWSEEVKRSMKEIARWQTPVFRTTLKEYAGNNE